MKVRLASGSPRRRELLEQVGISYEVIHSHYEEDNTQKVRPATLVEMQALGKATAVDESDAYPIIGADTIVVFDDTVLGKPADKEEAKAMLRMLSGKTHQVMTGVAIRYQGKQVVFHDCTDVTMYPLSEADINAYVETGEPLDKAGSYGIQGIGALLVERITGSYTNVVGLPVEKVFQEIKKLQ